MDIEGVLQEYRNQKLQIINEPYLYKINRVEFSQH